MQTNMAHSSRTLLLLTLVALNASFVVLASEDETQEANWRPCGGLWESIGWERVIIRFTDELTHAQLGTNVQVFVPGCPAVNGSESKCIFRKNSTATMTIKFSECLTSWILLNWKFLYTETTESVPELERIIVARVPAPLDKKVEMPYGPAISPCLNSSLVSNDGGECVDGGVEVNKFYTYVSKFDVLASFPTVSSTLSVKFTLLKPWES